MVIFAIWFILVLAILTAFVMMTAYIYSKRILCPPDRRSLLTAFPDQFRLAYENAVFTTADGITLRGPKLQPKGLAQKV